MMQLVLKSGKYLFFFILILLMNSSCDEIDSQIPEAPVSIRLNIISHGINAPGTYYFPGQGYGKGIILYCMGFIDNRYQYYAFDAACTNEVNPTCQILKDEDIDQKIYPMRLSSFILTCTCCDSKYNLGDGAGFPIEGPAVAPLKQYRTTLFGDILRISN